MILHAYFARRFASTFLLVLGIFIGVLLLIDLVEQVRRFAGDGVPFRALIGLTMLSVPQTLYTILPLITIIAALTLFLSLARTSELVVSRASGRSAIKSLYGPVAMILVFGIAAVAAYSPVVTAAAARYDRVSDSLRGVVAPALSFGDEGIWLRQTDGQGGRIVIAADALGAEETELRDVTFYRFFESGVARERIEAASARLADGEWTLRDAKRWDFSLPNPEADARTFDIWHVPSGLSADYIADSFADPDEISLWELPGFIDDMEAAGFSAQRHRVHFHSELSSPLMLTAMMLVGAAFTMRHTRFGRTGAMVFAALATGFGLFFLRDFAQILGENGQISAVLAAWGPPVASLCLPLGLILHWEDG